MPRLVELIETTTNRGAGTPKESPTRNVTQYWKKDGEFIGEQDKYLLQMTVEEVQELVALEPKYADLLRDVVAMRISKAAPDVRNVIERTISEMVRNR